MPSIITVKLVADEDMPTKHATEVMHETLRLLQKGLDGELPLRNLTLQIITHSELDALEQRNEVRTLLTGRPIGVDAKITLKTDESVEVRRMATVTPIDAYLKSLDTP